MAKLLIFGVFCLAVCMQMCQAKDLAEAIDNDIRERLKGYEKFLSEDDGSHKDDLKKVIELTESALKANAVETKQTILKEIPDKFTPEFNKYISAKLGEYQVNGEIAEAIQFYKSLLSVKAELKDEIEKTIAKLETFSKNTNLKEKEEQFLALNKDFSPEFQKFLAENAVPQLNRELQKYSEFFDTLLVQSDIKFQTEIKELKTQADAALASNNVEEKQTSLQHITNPKNAELFQFLQTKFIEFN